VTYEELCADYESGALHPGDLKPALAKHLNAILQPVGGRWAWGWCGDGRTWWRACGRGCGRGRGRGVGHATIPQASGLPGDERLLHWLRVCLVPCLCATPLATNTLPATPPPPHPCLNRHPPKPFSLSYLAPSSPSGA